jgi:hypothetical protein
MGILDDAKNTLTELVDGHGQQVGEGIDKAGDLVDEKTGGQFSDQVDSGQDLAKNALDGLDGIDDDIS